MDIGVSAAVPAGVDGDLTCDACCGALNPRGCTSLKIALYVGALLGVALLTALAVRVDIAAMFHTLLWAGWPLLWLIPYRILFFLLYALGWVSLLRPYDPTGKAGLGYLFWVSTVRDAIDRLLPVASIGGGVAAVRLLRWRGLALAQIGASVIVEILLTLAALYVFFVVGGLLLLERGVGVPEHRAVLLACLASLPIPVVTALLLRHGSVFARLHSFLLGLVGASPLTEGGASLDREVSSSLRRSRSLLFAGSLQFVALVSGSLEIWFALRLFGHPVDWQTALILESMNQAIRHVAFVVPAGLGVQEAGLMLFGRTLGLDAELALAVSMAKRLREVAWGVMSLLSWQWAEGHRIHRQLRDRS
jgi:putative membrane protein